MQKALGISVGIIFWIIALVYFIEPAHSLPHFMPGYSAILSKHHYTHGVVAVVLGLLAFAYAWFHSGKNVKS